jgi:hypothetical protein
MATINERTQQMQRMKALQTSIGVQVGVGATDKGMQTEVLNGVPMMDAESRTLSIFNIITIAQLVTTVQNGLHQLAVTMERDKETMYINEIRAMATTMEEATATTSMVRQHLVHDTVHDKKFNEKTVDLISEGDAKNVMEMGIQMEEYEYHVLSVAVMNEVNKSSFAKNPSYDGPLTVIGEGMWVRKLGNDYLNSKSSWTSPGFLYNVPGAMNDKFDKWLRRQDVENGSEYITFLFCRTVWEGSSEESMISSPSLINFTLSRTRRETRSRRRNR